MSFLFAVAITLPLQARSKNESYISFDDGGTVVRTGDDNREIDGRVNLPVFPGDEVITNRRGRAEVRLADGNVVGIDRATSIRFNAILDSYDSDSNDTVAELRYGKVAVFRSGDASESFRLDTPSASYYAGNEAIFSVETDSHGKDHLAVFDGPVEVRTPSRTARVRSGESVDVDDRGLYDLTNDEHSSADDFERWFIQRTEKYGNSNSRYLDRSLAYYDDELQSHGTWTFISGFGWGWRPYVGASWRPYYYGQWAYGPSGCLNWVSYEPWGWVPYHYGRWSYDPMYGWFWLPGAAYSPAWVYWMYGPGYVGWAPAGFYDCYRPYYDWAYRPYARAGFDFGFGFWGRVRVNEIDLRPWTFIDANTIVSGRVDRAALSADIVRGRLTRAPVDMAAITGAPARFGRNDLRDPAGAVNEIYRRGLTGATGQVVPATDTTPFFRRDAELPAAVRDRIVRGRPVDGAIAVTRPGMSGGGLAPIGGGSVAPIGSGSAAPIGRGSVAPIAGGSPAPTTGGVHRGDGGSSAPQRDSGSRDNGGRISRGSGGGARHEEVTPVTPAPAAPSWRDSIKRSTPSGEAPGATPSPATPRNNWRSGSREEGAVEPAPAATPSPDRASGGRSRAVDRSGGSSNGSDVPRRVIDGIGGTRIYRGEGSTPPPPRAPETRQPARESSPPPPPPHRESPPPQRSNDSGSRSEGGRVHRDKQ